MSNQYLILSDTNLDTFVYYTTDDNNLSLTTISNMAQLIDRLTVHIQALEARVQALEAQQPPAFSEDGEHG